MTQLSLLKPCLAATQTPILSFEPAPFGISLEPGKRFYFRVVQGDRAFTYKVIQLTELEAVVVFRGLSRLDWRLTEAGLPQDLQAIDSYIAAAIGSVE